MPIKPPIGTSHSQHTNYQTTRPKRPDAGHGASHCRLGYPPCDPTLAGSSFSPDAPPRTAKPPPPRRIGKQLTMHLRGRVRRCAAFSKAKNGPSLAKKEMGKKRGKKDYNCAEMGNSLPAFPQILAARILRGFYDPVEGHAAIDPGYTTPCSKDPVATGPRGHGADGPWIKALAARPRLGLPPLSNTRTT